VVLGFSWLAGKVMNQGKEQGIRLIVVKDLVTTNSSKGGFGSYYSGLVATK
jgi:hypothetical protein